MILLSAGHYPEKQGACHNGWCEHPVAVWWADITANLIRGQMPVDIVPTGRLSQKVRYINEQKDVALMCEIHFNSDVSKRQSGSETLYCPGSRKGKIAAEIVQAELAGVFPPSRGAKEGWYKMDKPGQEDYPGDVEGDEKPDYILAYTKPVALIVEPEFIYNKTLIEQRRTAGCAALAKGLLKAVEAIA